MAEFSLPQTPHIFSIADAKEDQAKQMGLELQTQAGILQLGKASLDWIAGLPADKQIIAYRSFQQKMSSLGVPKQWLPDMSDPAQIAQMLPKMSDAAMTALQRIQAGESLAKTKQAEVNTALAPVKVQNQQQETQSRLALTKELGEERLKQGQQRIDQGQQKLDLEKQNLETKSGYLAQAKGRIGTPLEQPGDKELASKYDAIMQNIKDSSAAKAQGTMQGQRAGVDPDTVTYVVNAIESGASPNMLGLIGGGLRDAVFSKLQKDLEAKGASASSIAAQGNIRKAFESSLVFSQKQFNQLHQYDETLNNQIDSFNKIKNELVQREGVRALDAPLRSLKTSAIGSAGENIANEYMTEISAEQAKIASGAVGSVRPVSPEMMKEWQDRINDPRLTMNKLGEILEAGKNLAQMRVKAASNEITGMQGQLRRMNVSDPTGEAAKTYPEGSTSTTADGKPIIYRNGQWEYK